MNAPTRTNNTLSNLKSLLRNAVASKAFFWTLMILGMILMCWIFSLIANACVAAFGEVLGIAVYLVICFALIYAVEILEKRAARAIFVASIRRR